MIPARNAAALLPMQLEALANQTFSGSWEVVIADNGSSDDTAGVALAWRDKLPHLRVVNASARSGASHARNVGARAAKGQLLLFCDADDEAAPGWLAAMIQTARHFDAVGGPLDNERLNDPVSFSWHRKTALNELPVVGGFLPYALTANCGVWAEVLNELEGFDETYRSAGEDTEFFWRLQLKGFTLGFSEGASMHRRLRDDLYSLAKQFYGYGKSGPLLYKSFRAQGMPRSSITMAVRSWAWIVLHGFYLLADRSRKGQWVRAASMRAGKMVGSLKARTLWL